MDPDCRRWCETVSRFYGFLPGFEDEAFDQLQTELVNLQSLPAGKAVRVVGLIDGALRLYCTGRYGTPREHIEAKLAEFFGEENAAAYMGIA